MSWSVQCDSAKSAGIRRRSRAWSSQHVQPAGAATEDHQATQQHTTEPRHFPPRLLEPTTLQHKGALTRYQPLAPERRPTSTRGEHRPIPFAPVIPTGPPPPARRPRKRHHRGLLGRRFTAARAERTGGSGAWAEVLAVHLRLRGEHARNPLFQLMFAGPLRASGGKPCPNLSPSDCCWSSPRERR